MLSMVPLCYVIGGLALRQATFSHSFLPQSIPLYRLRAISEVSNTLSTSLTALFVNEATSKVSDNESHAGLFVNVEDRPGPRPPDYPPYLSNDSSSNYEMLQQQGNETAFRVRVLEDRVHKLQTQLEKKERDLLRKSDEWKLERDSLLGKLAEFAATLQGKEQEEEEDFYERDRLQREVELLQDQMVQAMNALRIEQRTASEIKERLVELEDALEYDQMAFEETKRELLQTVDDERKKAADVQLAWEEDKKRLTSAKESVQQQLNEESNRLIKVKEDWMKNQENYEIQEKALRMELAVQKELLKNRTAELAAERADLAEDRVALQKALEVEKRNLQEVERLLKQEHKRFHSVQAELEKNILTEQAVVAELQNRLNQEKQRFDEEQAILKARIESDQERFFSLEQRLAIEQKTFFERESKLKGQLENEVRLGKIKKRQMHDRYSAIRKEMTSLWEGSKRDARKEKNRLTKKFEHEVANLTKSLVTLEQGYNDVKKANANLKARLADMSLEKEKSQAELLDIERRFMATLARRNQELSTLTNSLGNLRSTVKEQEDLIRQYQSSYRMLLNLTIKLTGKRFRRSSSNVARWITRGSDIQDEFRL